MDDELGAADVVEERGRDLGELRLREVFAGEPMHARRAELHLALRVDVRVEHALARAG